MKADVKAVRAWSEGKPSAFDPKADLEPLLASGLTLADTLPVNVFTRWLADRTKAEGVKVRAIASLFQTNLEVERDGDRLQELFAFYAGLGLPVYLGPARPAGHGRVLPRDGPGARGEELPVAGGHDRRRVADRRPQELELGREEPRHPGRQGARPRAARGAGREGPRPAHQGAARTADRRDRPLLHHAAPLVHARVLRARGDGDRRAREPEGGVPPVPGRRADLDPGRQPLLRRRRRLEAAAGAARGHQPDRRGPRELPAVSAAALRRRERRSSPSTTCTTPRAPPAGCATASSPSRARRA